MEAQEVELATLKIKRARSELILTRTFYGVLVGQVEPVASDQFPTMATNGKVHYFRPSYINNLDQEEVLGTQAHESEHDARRHHTRRGNRDPKEWNICCDYAINIDLVDQGFKLPKGALIDAKYRGMSAEDIYRTREIERAEEERKRQEQQEKEAKEQEAEDEADEPEQGDDGDEGQEDEQPETETGEDEDAGEDEDGEDEGQDGDDGDEADQDDGDGQGGDAEGDDSDQDGEGAGEGQDGDGDNGEAEGAGKAEGEAEADGQGKGTGDGEGEAQGDAKGNGGAGQPTSCGDPGMCGEVLDAAPDAASRADEDAKWERVLRQAASLSAKRGEGTPGHISREIERADHPPQDWREVLRAYFDGGATTSETWNRPNRRFIGSGLYLPGRQRDGVNKVVFMIDTSGSVTFYPGALESIQVETQAALDEGIIEELVVIYGDVAVTRIDHYRNGGDEIEFDPRGGGDTNMKPLFKHIADEIENASLVVAFTDLDIGDPGPEPSCPVLWAVVGYPARVQAHLANTPWNAPGIEVRPDR